MLAKTDGGRLPADPAWAYEYKLDGYRACMRIAPDGTTVLTSRNGIDFTDEFADLATVLAPALDGKAVVLDGEVVAYNAVGRVDFERMQERRGRYQTHRSSIRRAEPFESDIEVRFIAFDLLHLAGRSLLDTPYDERRARLAALPMPDPYRVSVVRRSPSPTWTPTAAPRPICSTTSKRPGTRAWSRNSVPASTTPGAAVMGGASTR
jgi:bifunctional non-homologous end joining protein LigD